MLIKAKATAKVFRLKRTHTHREREGSFSSVASHGNRASSRRVFSNRFENLTYSGMQWKRGRTRRRCHRWLGTCKGGAPWAAVRRGGPCCLGLLARWEGRGGVPGNQHGWQTAAGAWATGAPSQRSQAVRINRWLVFLLWATPSAARAQAAQEIRWRHPGGSRDLAGGWLGGRWVAVRAANADRLRWLGNFGCRAERSLHGFRAPGSIATDSWFSIFSNQQLVINF
jgi:hypothetical protein